MFARVCQRLHPHKGQSVACVAVGFREQESRRLCTRAEAWIGALCHWRSLPVTSTYHSVDSSSHPALLTSSWHSFLSRCLSLPTTVWARRCLRRVGSSFTGAASSQDRTGRCWRRCVWLVLQLQQEMDGLDCACTFRHGRDVSVLRMMLAQVTPTPALVCVTSSCHAAGWCQA